MRSNKRDPFTLHAEIKCEVSYLNSEPGCRQAGWDLLNCWILGLHPQPSRDTFYSCCRSDPADAPEESGNESLEFSRHGDGSHG